MAALHPPGTRFGDLRWPGHERWRRSLDGSLLNKVLRRLRAPWALAHRFDHRRDMVSLEQVGNFQLLTHSVLDHGIPGAFVELGSYTGSTMAVFSQLLAGTDRELHAFDRFDIVLGNDRDVRGQFDRTLSRYGAVHPQVHPGDLRDTVPGQLPDRIAFAHIDLGCGGDMEEHIGLLEHALKHVYERLSPGGVALFMDYYEPGLTVHGFDSNPGVRVAVDRFLQGRPETIRPLYGGPCAHAYLRKQ